MRARTLQRLSLLALLLLAAAAPVRAQTAADSLLIIPDSLKVYRVSPQYTNKIGASVSSVDMLNEFQAALSTPWGSSFNVTLSGGEKNYRLQNRLEETKLMQLTDLHMFNIFWQGSLTASDSRVFNRSIAVGGGVQDFIINDQMVNVNTTYRRHINQSLLGRLRYDAAGTGGVINSERTFKNDSGFQAGANGGASYYIGRRISVQGRGAVRRTWDKSTFSDSTITGLGSDEDSLATAVGFEVADSIRFDIGYQRYSGDRDFTDQRRGALGSQQGGAENVFKETEMRDTRNTTLRMKSLIFNRLHLGMVVSHDEQVFDYAVDSTRYSRTVGDNVSGDVSYRLPWGTTSSLQFENGETLRDLGPTSISSLTDKRRRVQLMMTQQFSRSFSMSFSGSSTITQSFYLDYEANPRDRDQVDSNLNLRITSLPFTKVSASVALQYSVSEVVNIDETQSRDNRTRELWDLRPQFSFFVTPVFTIMQSYGLSFEYTDYVYQADQNYLDRNITFTNTFLYRPTKKIDTVFEYALTLHDKGSYLPDPVTGERLLEVSSEDRRDRTRIRVDYRPIGRITFFGENLYSNFQDEVVGSGEVDTTVEGQITVGTSADYIWGPGKKLRFLVARVKRFSPLGSEEEKNYWDARSEFAYTF
jgi:hypothetical protein